MRFNRRLAALVLAVVPLLIIGPLVSLAGSIAGAGADAATGSTHSHIGAAMLVAAILSLSGATWGLVTEPRPWKGWRIWPFVCAAPAAVLLAGIWLLYLHGSL